jgi:hypothetical protein
VSIKSQLVIKKKKKKFIDASEKYLLKILPGKIKYKNMGIGFQKKKNPSRPKQVRWTYGTIGNVIYTVS